MLNRLIKMNNCLEAARETNATLKKQLKELQENMETEKLARQDTVSVLVICNKLVELIYD